MRPKVITETRIESRPIEHIHIVWQEGNELRRGKVYPPGLVASELQLFRNYYQGGPRFLAQYNNRTYADIDSSVFWENTELHSWLYAHGDPDTLHDKFRAKYEQWLKWSSSYVALYEQILETDQLFIAV